MSADSGPSTKFWTDEKVLLGYSPKVPLPQGLGLTFDWYAKHIKGIEIPVAKTRQR